MDLEFKSADGSPEIVNSKYYKAIFGGFLLLLINAGYLAGASSSSIFYYANIVLHIVLGLLLIVPLYTKVRHFIKTDMLIGKTFGETVGRVGYLAMQFSFWTGIYLLIVGNVSGEGHVFFAHAITGFFAAMCLISSIRRAAYNVSVENTYWRAGRWGLTIFVISLVIPLFSFMIHSAFVDDSDSIQNEGIIPSSLEEANDEGDESLFYPSPAETESKKLLDTRFMQESQSCGRVDCHIDIARQFADSRHNTSSLDHPLYLATFSYVQNRFGDDAGKFCAGCHTPAQLFDGSVNQATLRMSAQERHMAKFSCASCHAIQSVKNTLGNGAYILDKPAIANLSISKNEKLNKLHDFLVFADPDPHREFMFQPFMKKQSGEFCSACHKLTLEKPFVQKSPVPGLTNYDYWAGSSFARQDIKAFGSIQDDRGCVDCHMPDTRGSEPGNSKAIVSSHSFKMPKAGIVDFMDAGAAADSLGENTKRLFEVEIFAVRPQLAASRASLPEHTQPQFANAVISSAGATSGTSQMSKKSGHDLATRIFDRSSFRAGSVVEVDVLIKSGNIGHAFPAGSPGASEAWLEIAATDEQGNIFYHIGSALDDKDVDPNAPYFGVQFLDNENQPVFWAHGIGAEKVERFNLLIPNAVYLSQHKFRLPEEAGRKLHISAKLHYRKRTFFAAAATDSHDETNGGTHGKDASSNGAAHGLTLKYGPITTLSTDELHIGHQSNKSALKQRPDSAQVWNDYGIGFLLQNESLQARMAFEHAVQLQPELTEAYVNISRTFLLTGEHMEAQKALERVPETDRDLPKVQFFLALAHKGQGDFDTAKDILSKLRKDIPEDRAILNELGHTYYLLDSYIAAHRMFRAVTRFAPDDPIAHYFLSHTFRKQKKLEKAAFEEKLFAKYSKRMNQYVVSPSLELEKAYQPWQILPWMNYDNYAFSQSQ